MGSLWMLILVGGLLAGCSGRMAGLAGELSTGLDAYVAEYQARYAVAPRRGDTPLAIAEAYMAEYQPGPLPRVFQTTRLYDRNGALLAELAEEGDRTWVPLARISPHLIDAIIATEDASFYSNPGFDARRVLGALVQNAEAGEVVSGASTITMQLARQLFFTPAERFEQSLDRKAYETLLAQDLTLTYSKDELLEMYLNLAHFGRTVYGIEAAANLYFGKSAADLTLAEATLLAGIPQQPADYDPLTNLPVVQQRQAVVLSLLVRHGYLSEAAAAEVAATPLALRTDITRPPVVAPHFVQYVIADLNRRLGGARVERSGLQIETTLDSALQALAQQTVAEQVARLQPQFDLSNAALVALKPGTAEILVMVGSADFSNPAIAGQVNVATSLRQPGSAIKPVLYALALDDGQISPSTVIWDVEAEYKLADDELYTPRNYDDTFHGPVTARSALANSYNIPAVKLLDAIGVPRMLEGARSMGIPSLNRDSAWYGLSLTLGGGEVTLLDLTTAFHTLANAGRYLPPQAVRGVRAALPTLTPDVTPPDAVAVISPEAAYLVTHILSDNQARTPAFGAASPLLLSRPAAAKTGTTTDYRDNWTQGYTRYLVAGVWAGNSDGRPMRNVSGVTGAAPIWHAFMEAVLADPTLLARLEAPAEDAAWEFPVPPGVVGQAAACPPGVTCPEVELYSQRWLERWGSAGPLADSVIAESMNTVYVDTGRGSIPLGACSEASGTTRQLLRLPVGLTRVLPAGEAAESLPPLDEDRGQRVRDEQEAALAWSAEADSPLYFGPCDQAEAVARGIFGDALLAVSVQPFTEQIAALDGDAPVLVAVDPAMAPANPSTYYTTPGVAHSNSCGENAVLGSVYNAQGQLISAVVVIYRDEFGNRNFAAAANGGYRLPVLAPDVSHGIFLHLEDAMGVPVSDTVFVPHRQGGASDQPCHYVIWQGVD